MIKRQAKNCLGQDGIWAIAPQSKFSLGEEDQFQYIDQFVEHFVDDFVDTLKRTL